MNIKKIEINSKYYVVITYKNDITRLYTLRESKEDKEICCSFNRDSFLLKANQYVKISNKLECLIASI